MAGQQLSPFAAIASAPSRLASRLVVAVVLAGGLPATLAACGGDGSSPQPGVLQDTGAGGPGLGDVGGDAAPEDAPGDDGSAAVDAGPDLPEPGGAPFPGDEVGPFCAEVCADIGTVCGVFGAFGGDEAGCLAQCQAQLADSADWAAAYSCQATACISGLCLPGGGPPAQDGAECALACDAIVGCGAAPGLGITSDESVCAAWCVGQSLASPELGDLWACYGDALELTCDFVAAGECAGPTGSAAQECVDACAALYDPLDANYCAPGTALASAWPTVTDCALACPAFEDSPAGFYQFLGCAYSRGCQEPSLCESIDDPPTPVCVEGCQAQFERCGGGPLAFLPSPGACAHWCTGIAEGVPLPGSAEVVTCLEEAGACPGDPNAAYGQLIGCVFPELVGAGGDLCTNLCSGFYGASGDGALACDPGDPLLAVWPDLATCQAACAALPGVPEQLAFYGCMTTQGCGEPSACLSVEEPELEACEAICLGLAGVCDGVAIGFQDTTVCTGVCSGLVAGLGFTPLETVGECAAALEACPPTEQGQQIAFWQCLVPPTETCGTFCDAQLACGTDFEDPESCAVQCELGALQSDDQGLDAFVACMAAGEATDCDRFGACAQSGGELPALCESACEAVGACPAVEPCLTQCVGGFIGSPSFAAVAACLQVAGCEGAATCSVLSESDDDLGCAAACPAAGATCGGDAEACLNLCRGAVTATGGAPECVVGALGPGCDLDATAACAPGDLGD